MPWGWDIVPGINVGNGIKQFFTGKDYDVFPGYTDTRKQETIDPGPDNSVVDSIVNSYRNTINSTGGNKGGEDNTATYDSVAAQSNRERDITITLTSRLMLVINNTVISMLLT